MNKKTAVLSGVLVMLGAITAVGIVAYSAEEDTPTAGGMIKKGIKSPDTSRMEYSATPKKSPYTVAPSTKTPMAELLDINKAFAEFLSQYNKIVKDLTKEQLKEAREQMTKDWEELKLRHKGTADAIKQEYRNVMQSAESLYQRIIQTLP